MVDLRDEQLWEEIEQLRDKLYEAIHKKGIKSSEAFRVSHILDDKMNEYYHLKKQTLR